MIFRKGDIMFTNKSGCTIYEKTVINRAPDYIRHITGPVYWEPSIGETVSKGETDGKDRSEQNSIFISIPAGSVSYTPKTNDRIVGEIISDETPPVTAHTVMNVKDLRYGSKRVQHIELIAR